MADRAQRKHRRELKRKQKQRQLHRLRDMSPYRRAAGGELLACRVNDDWRERGQATIFVLRRGGGELAMACFLVDLWCAGLKDAWGRAGILPEDYDDAVERMEDMMDTPVAHCPLETAQQIVAGGIRFAVQNGFRLCERYNRWTAFLGGDLDWRNADLRDFGVEDGKLRWVAPLEDLRARLIGCTVEEFLARPDVEYIFELEGEGTFFEESDEADDADEADEQGAGAVVNELASTIRRTTAAAQEWCRQQGMAPDPRLLDAMTFTVIALMQAEADDPQSVEQRMRQAFDRLEPEDRDGLAPGIEQIRQFMRGFDSPAKLLKAIRG